MQQQICKLSCYQSGDIPTYTCTTGHACIAVAKQATYLSMYSYQGSLNAGMKNANLRASPGSTGPGCGTHQVPQGTPASSAQPAAGCLGIQAGSWTGGFSATRYGKTLQVPRWQRKPTLELSKLAVVGLIMLSGILLSNWLRIRDVKSAVGLEHLNDQDLPDGNGEGGRTAVPYHLDNIHAVTHFAGPIFRFEAYVDTRGERYESLKKMCKHFVRQWI
jgi:hypothetical protein